MKNVKFNIVGTSILLINTKSSSRFSHKEVNSMEEYSKSQSNSLHFSKKQPDNAALIQKRLEIINHQIEWLTKIKTTLERQLYRETKLD